MVEWGILSRYLIFLLFKISGGVGASPQVLIFFSFNYLKLVVELGHLQRYLIFYSLITSWGKEARGEAACNLYVTKSF